MTQFIFGEGLVCLSPLLTPPQSFSTDFRLPGLAFRGEMSTGSRMAERRGHLSPSTPQAEGFPYCWWQPEISDITLPKPPSPLASRRRLVIRWISRSLVRPGDGEHSCATASSPRAPASMTRKSAPRYASYCRCVFLLARVSAGRQLHRLDPIEAQDPWLPRIFRVRRIPYLFMLVSVLIQSTFAREKSLPFDKILRFISFARCLRENPQHKP